MYGTANPSQSLMPINQPILDLWWHDASERTLRLAEVPGQSVKAHGDGPLDSHFFIFPNDLGIVG